MDIKQGQAFILAERPLKFWRAVESHKGSPAP